MKYIGLDIGTSGVKAVIFNGEGKIISFAYKGYDCIFPDHGLIELDPEDIWSSVKLVLSQALIKAGSKDIKACAISSFGEAFVPIDKTGNVLRKSIVATDPRGKAELEMLLNKIPRSELMRVTGLPPSITYSIIKILWIKNNETEIYKRIWKFLLIQDFICFKLCGEIVTNPSLASRTMAFDVEEGKWSPKILDAIEIDKSLFSKIISSGTLIGQISKKTAMELGLSKPFMLAMGSHDQPCAALGAGVINDRMALISTGSTEGIISILPKKLLQDSIEEFNFPREPFVINGVYNTLAYNHTAGFLLKWFIETFISRNGNELKDTEILKYFDSMCPEPPTEIFVLPHFSGSGTPHMDADSKGAIIGLNLSTSKYEIYKAFLEGMTYELACNLECLNKFGVQISSIRAAGGGANSKVWLQIKADIFNKEITTLECNETAALGASILAAKACSDFKSLKYAIKSMVRQKETFYPDEAKADIYMKKLDIYKKIYPILKEINNNI